MHWDWINELDTTQTVTIRKTSRQSLDEIASMFELDESQHSYEQIDNRFEILDI
jgi:hypothetical protein